MSMSTHVVGFKPPDEHWKKMKAVWDACRAAGIKLPDDVNEFFDGCTPDDSGVEVDMASSYGVCHESITEHHLDGEQGFQVDLKKAPSDIRYLRFYNSY